MFVSGKPFQPSKMFVGKAKNFPKGGAHGIDVIKTLFDKIPPKIVKLFNM